MVDSANLDDIKRQLENIEHDLENTANTRPRNGAEITLALRKVQEAIFWVNKAKENE